MVTNEEKLVALLVYSSFKRAASSSFWRLFVATSSIGQNFSSSSQRRSQYGVTPFSVQHRANAEWLD